MRTFQGIADVDFFGGHDFQGKSQCFLHRCLIDVNWHPK